jgi:spore germination protein YaaH/flagellar hook assembly protein FlgD
VRFPAALLAALFVTTVVAPVTGANAAVSSSAPSAAAGSASARPIDRAARAHEPGAEAASHVRTSIHYADVLAHSDDRPVFTAGGRVTVPFVPRADDPWKVGGRTPHILPAGRATGRQLAFQPTGTVTLRPEPETGGDSAAPADAEIKNLPLAPPPVEDEPEAATTGSRPGSEEQGDPGSDAAARIAPVEQQTVAPQAAVGDRLRREVFGFLPYWELSDSALRLDYTALSTIAYFGVGANSSGHLIKRDSDGTLSTGWAGWTSSKMTAILNEAHAARTRVVLTVERFSWTSSQASQTSALLSSSTARQTLAKEIAAAVRDRGADGVNLDFEPIPSGQGANFVTFVRQVRAALDAQASGYQLTFDSTGYIGNYDVAALTARGAADAVFIMGYDYRTAGAKSAGSIAPANGPAYDLTDTLRVFLARTSPSKVILGLPYYGRAWSTVSDAPNAATRPQGSTYGNSAAVLYREAAALAAANGRRYDSLEQSAWTAYTRRNCDTCPNTWRELYFDDAQSLAAKYDLVNYSDLRGTGMWALGYDGTRPELYALLKQKFVNDRTRPYAGIANLAPVSRDEGIHVDWTALDDYTGITYYDVQVSRDGGAWTPWLTGTRAGEGTYMGQTGHGYAFRVRAMDGVGNWSLWNVASTWRATPGLAPGGFGRVAVPGLTLRSGPTTTAGELGTLAANDLVAISSGPVEAEGYRWYQVTGPLRTWGLVDWTIPQGAWVAAGNDTETYLTAAQSPNATTVQAGITALDGGGVHEVSLTSAGSSASPSSGPSVFSPNGDETMDALRVTYRVVQPIDAVALRVYRRSSRALIGERELPGVSVGSHAFDWDGKLGGAVVSDGAVLLQLVGTRDGVTYSAPAADMRDTVLDMTPFTFTVDTTPPALSGLAASSIWFSPNGDGVKDSTRITASAAGATRWSVEISNASGIVRTMSGSGQAVVATWNGRNAAGARVPDGTYLARVRAVDLVGNRSSVSRNIVVDTAAPSGSVRAVVSGLPQGATPYSFSPNGDGVYDQARLTWSASHVSTGVVTVRKSSGALVWYRSFGYAESGAVTWNGRDRYGRAAPNGTYRLAARLTDLAGNSRIVTGVVNVTRAAGFLAGTWLFYPSDGDALATNAPTSFRLANYTTTTLRVLSNGNVVRTAWTGLRRAPGTYRWTWNGRDAAGRYVREGGPYIVQLIASRYGITQVYERPIWSSAFSVALSSYRLTPGNTLTVTSLSSEPIRGAPVVTFAQAGLTPQTASAALQANGTWKAAFTVLEGGPGPATVTVAATDINGGPNASTRSVTVN